MQDKHYKKFEDLHCWQEARTLVKMVYLITREQPFAKDFGLCDQLKRSAVSVMANIAEGFGTFSDTEFIRFLNFTVRSCCEVQSHLYVAKDVEYINDLQFTELYEQTTKCDKITRGLIKYLKNK